MTAESLEGCDQWPRIEDDLLVRAAGEMYCALAAQYDSIQVNFCMVVVWIGVCALDSWCMCV